MTFLDAFIRGAFRKTIRSPYILQNKLQIAVKILVEERFESTLRSLAVYYVWLEIPFHSTTQRM